LAGCLLASLADAQYVGKPGESWRGAGPQPCFGIDGGANKCPAGPQVVAIRAGRLFDSKAGVLLNNQIDVNTGTISIKAHFPNNQHKLWPGQSVDARVVLGERVGSTVTPA